MGADIFELMAGMEGGSTLSLPPPSFEEAGAEIIEYHEGKSIVVRFPLYEKYNNPVGVILGGYLSVFFDLTFGPLAYLVTRKPSTSLDINTTFIRPMKPSDGAVTIKSTVVNMSNSYLLLDAHAYVADDKLIATATSRLRILG
ncbi:MAG: PaaI family thioesterase [Woeseiaceae bacterium]|nr:PaaI family thioesterase [Woeseiaceae bacterium]